MAANLYDRYKDKLDKLSKAMTTRQRNYVNLVTELGDFYDGDHRSMEGSTGHLSQMFPQSYAGGKLRLSSQPFLKRLIDAGATLFHRRPEWELKSKGEILPADNPDAVIWEALRKETRLDLTCRYIQRKDQLWNTVFARVAHRLDRIKVDVLSPAMVEVVESPTDPADLDDAVAIVVRLDDDRREIWEKPSPENGNRWTYGVVDFNKGTVTDPLFGGTGINEYQTYPFVVFNHNPATGIYGVVDQTLLDAQVAVDVLESWADFQFRLGFSIAVIKTAMDLGKDALPISPDMLVKLNPGGEESFERKPSGLDTAQLTNYIEAKVKRFAAMAAIDPDFLSSDGKQFLSALTGIAKHYDRLDLQEKREESEIPYEYALADLFDKLRTVNNWHRGDQTLDTELTLGIRWYEPTQPQNRLQEAQADVLDVQAGVLTPEEVRAKRLNIPAAEAKATIKEPVEEAPNAGPQG